MLRIGAFAVRAAMRRLRSVPALRIRRRVRAADKTVERMFESAERAAARHGARAVGRPFMLRHDGSYGGREADVEVCIPVLRAAVDAVGGRVVEGARGAVCLWAAGSYDQAPVAAETIERWTRAASLRRAGSLRETYIRFAAARRGYSLPKRVLARSEVDYLTEVQQPVSIR